MPESMPYIPGLSQTLFRGQMAPEISRAQEAFSGGASGLQSAQSKGLIAGWLGNLLLGGLSSGVKKSLLASGHPLMALLADPAMRATGQYIGEKWAGRGEKIKNPTGLFGEDFDVLRDIRKGMPEVSKGRAAGTFLSSVGSELKSEAGKELMGQFSNIYKQRQGISPKLSEVGEGFYDPSKVIPSDLSSDMLPDMPGDPMSELSGMFGKEFPLGSAEVAHPSMPQAGFMDKLRSGAGQAGDVLSNLLYSGKNLGESEWTEKPYWWQDPQVSAYDKQGYPSRMMGSKWGGSGMQEGGSVSSPYPQQSAISRSQRYAGLLERMIKKFGGEVPEGMYTPEGGMTREGYANLIGADPESVDIDTLAFTNPANYKFKISGKGKETGVDVGGTTKSMGMLPLETLLDKVMRKNIEDPFERMDWESRLEEVSPYSNFKRYQQGGQIPEYAGGGPVGGLIQYRKGY